MSMPKLTQWEYLAIPLSDIYVEQGPMPSVFAVQDYLSDKGLEGWELCALYPFGALIFKRPIRVTTIETIDRCPRCGRREHIGDCDR